MDCDVTRISLADYVLPIYDGDLEASDGVPKNALKLAQSLDLHDGYFIASPEYNGSITPLLKNSLDWISRVGAVDGKPVSPFRGKVAAIASASPDDMDSTNTLYHLREILVRLGSLVVSDQVAVRNAGDAFDELGKISDERTAGFLASCCKSLAYTASQLRSEP